MNTIILVAFACAGVSFTITSTSIFLLVREWISKLGHKAEELIHCPWCLNHYITFIAYMITPIPLISGIVFLDYMIVWFSMITVGGLIHFILLRAYKPVTRRMAEREIQRIMKLEP